MATSNAVDIVMDVMRAADPAAVNAARDKLRSMSTQTGGSQPAFEVASAPQRPSGDTVTAEPESYARFEAMVLQTFIQQMLPEDTESVYGSGVAGEMWQSMLAEKLADTMAERGGIGIAERVLKDTYMNGDERVPLAGAGRDPERAAVGDRKLWSTGIVHEIERQIAQTMAEGDVSASAATFKR